MSKRRPWRDEEPPKNMITNRLAIREIMPIDHMPVREVALPPMIARASVRPYRERLKGLVEAERVQDMRTTSYSIENAIPDETLALADRIWFGLEKPFGTAREAWRNLQEQLEMWETELQAERARLAESIPA